VPDYAGGDEITVRFEPGDTLLLYTDGVTDTPGPGGRFGEPRLRAAVDAAPRDPEALLEAVSAALESYASGTGLDDRAMLALQHT
jgi:serine phosphatase RsbU (regulator of sigma subunit)